MISSPSSHFTYVFLIMFFIIPSILSTEHTVASNELPLIDSSLSHGEFIKFVTDLEYAYVNGYVADEWHYTPKSLVVTPMPKNSFAMMGTGRFTPVTDLTRSGWNSYALMRLGIRFNGSDSAVAYLPPSVHFWDTLCAPLVRDCFFEKSFSSGGKGGGDEFWRIHLLVRPIVPPNSLRHECMPSQNKTYVISGDLYVRPNATNLFRTDDKYEIDYLFNETYVTKHFGLSTGGLSFRHTEDPLEITALTRTCRRPPFTATDSNAFESYVISRCTFESKRCETIDVAAPSNVSFSTPPDLVSMDPAFGWEVAAVFSVQAPLEGVPVRDRAAPFVPLQRQNVTVTRVLPTRVERKLMFEHWIHWNASSPCSLDNTVNSMEFAFLRLSDAHRCLAAEVCQLRVVYVSAEAGSYSVHVVELDEAYNVLSTRNKSLETTWHESARDEQHVVTVTNMRATEFEPPGRRLLVLLVQFYVMEPDTMLPSEEVGATHITYYFDLNSETFDFDYVIGFVDAKSGKTYGVNVQAPIILASDQLVAKSSGAALLLLGPERTGVQFPGFWTDEGTVLVGNTFYDSASVNTLAPTGSPTPLPTWSPSESPTKAPTQSPTKIPMPATTASAETLPTSVGMTTTVEATETTPKATTLPVTSDSGVVTHTEGHTTEGFTSQAVSDDSPLRDIVLVLLVLVIASICVIIGCFVVNQRRQRALKNRLDAMSLLDNGSDMEESDFLSDVRAGIGENGSPPRSGLDELATIDHRQVKLGDIVGTGSFGQVHRARWRRADVAVKLLRADANRDRFVDEFRLEAKRLRSLPPHPNVVTFYGVTTPMDDGGSIGLVFAYMPGGALDRVLYRGHFEEELSSSADPLASVEHGRSPMTSPRESMDSYGPVLGGHGSLRAPLKVSWIHGTLLGLHHLHSEGIVHRDLAARNILLDARWHAVIADFGMSRAIQDKESETQEVFTKHADFGPVQWMAPEQFRQKGIYSKMTDIYSFGCLIYEILMRSKPFEGLHLPDVIVKVCAGDRPVFDAERADGGFLPVALVRMAKQCWSEKPYNRPDTEELLSHSFFEMERERERERLADGMSKRESDSGSKEVIGEKREREREQQEEEEEEQEEEEVDTIGNIRSGLFENIIVSNVSPILRELKDKERAKEREEVEEREKEEESRSKQSSVAWEQFLSDDYLEENK